MRALVQKMFRAPQKRCAENVLLSGHGKGSGSQKEKSGDPADLPLWLRLGVILAVAVVFFVLIFGMHGDSRFESGIFWHQVPVAEQPDSGVPFEHGQRLTQRFRHDGILNAVRFGFRFAQPVAQDSVRFEVSLFDGTTDAHLETVVCGLPEGTSGSDFVFAFSQDHRSAEGQYYVSVTPYNVLEGQVTLAAVPEEAAAFCIGSGRLNGETVGFVSMTATGTNLKHLQQPYRVFCIGLFVCVLLICCIFLLLRCSPVLRFVLAAALLGLVCGTVFPPFTSYDEDRHFGTVYHEVQRLFDREKEAYLTPWEDHSGFRIFAIPGRTEDEREALYPISYRPVDYYRFYQLSDVSFGHANDSDGVVYMSRVDEPFAAAAYLPAVAGVFLGRLIGASGDILPLFARAANYIAYVALCAWGIAVAPRGRWLLSGCALLPSALLITCSAANDLYHCGTGILLIGLALYLAEKELPLRASHAAGIAVCLAAVLVSAQLQQLPLFVWIAWLLYRRKYTPQFGRRFWICVLALAAAALALWFAAVRLGVFSTPTDTDPDARLGLLYVLCHPLRAVGMMLCSAWKNGHTYYIQMVGTLLGWGYLNTGTLPLLLLTGVLLLAGIAAGSENRSHWSVRVLVCLCGLAIVGLSFCTGFPWTTLTYVRENGGTLWGIQGRYFISALPLLLLAFPVLPQRVLSPRRAQVLAGLACFGICLTDVFIFLRSALVYLSQ